MCHAFVVTAPATVHVFTFRRGLLARLGHDLRLHIARFELEVNGASVEGRFETGSLRVDGAMKRGVLDPDAISAGDRSEIERTISEEVLHASSFPSATLAAEVEAIDELRFALRGQLVLHGRSVRIACAVEPIGGRLVAELELVPSQLGIAPYRALGGTLALEDRVRIVVSVPDAGVTAAGMASASPRVRWVP
jgi:hypothetical protein